MESEKNVETLQKLLENEGFEQRTINSLIGMVGSVQEALKYMEDHPDRYSNYRLIPLEVELSGLSCHSGPQSIEEEENIEVIVDELLTPQIHHPKNLSQKTRTLLRKYMAILDYNNIEGFPYPAEQEQHNLQLDFEQDFREELIEEAIEHPLPEPEEEEKEIDLNVLYKRALQNSALTMAERFTNYSLANDFLGVLPRTLSRINKELSSLGKSLPCEDEGSIFVVANSENLSELRALIQGSSDTPYEHGLFLFDIKLPMNYPAAPPVVKLVTTGGHSVRFNPNLYANGKVCLSVINTWAGSPEEMWNPQFSTLLQVLISIESLVMNEDIIEKEPGFSSYSRESDENVAYRMVVRHGNMEFAIADMIANPPVELADIVRMHFSLKKRKVLETLEKWVVEAGEVENSVLEKDVQNNEYMSEISSGGLKTSFENSLNIIRDLLDRL